MADCIRAARLIVSRLVGIVRVVLVRWPAWTPPTRYKPSAFGSGSIGLGRVSARWISLNVPGCTSPTCRR